MLVYGDDSQQEISDEDNDSQANSDLEESLDRSDNWMKCLKPLAKVCNDDGTPLRGWFRFSDVLSVLPVSILCRTIDIAGEVSTCSACGLDGLGNNTNSYKVSNNYCLKAHLHPRLIAIVCFCFESLYVQTRDLIGWTHSSSSKRPPSRLVLVSL